MIIQPVDVFLLVWFALAALSTAYVAYDQFKNNPEPPVMKWGFILVTLYMGPIGLLLYVLADKEPRPGEHERFTAPLWKQGVGSTIHCVAGDATGIILAAVITALLGLPMWLDLMIEYAAGFAFGLFVFQSLFMQSMMGGSYLENVRKTFVPELISMNAMMAGMAPVMSLLMMGRDMRAMEPTELLFWGVMSLGVMAGFALAYPFNVWLVMAGLKHGLMTERRAGTKFDLARHEESPSHERVGQAEGHQSHIEAHTEGQTTQGHGKDGASNHGAHGHHMNSDATVPQIASLVGVTTLMLLIGIIAPAFMVNLTLSAKDVGGVIMPPGMIMDFDTPAEAMRDMGAVHPRHVSYTAAVGDRGDQVLQPHVQDGVKVFELEASVVRWHILDDVYVDAYAYNRQVPGPRLQITEGDRVRINFRNALPRIDDGALARFDCPERHGWSRRDYAAPREAGRRLHVRVHRRTSGHLLLPLSRSPGPPAERRALWRADYRASRQHNGAASGPRRDDSTARMVEARVVDLPRHAHGGRSSELLYD
jgi:hypothetical protein